MADHWDKFYYYGTSRYMEQAKRERDEYLKVEWKDNTAQFKKFTIPLIKNLYPRSLFGAQEDEVEVGVIPQGLPRGGHAGSLGSLLPHLLAVDEGQES